MAVRQDQVQIRLDILTDESKQYAKLINSNKTLIKDLIRAEKKGEDVSQAIRAIAQESRKVENIDLSKLTPAQLIQRSRQLATVLRRIPQSAPEYRDLADEVQRVNTQLARTRQETRGITATTNRLRTSSGILSTALGTLAGFTLAGAINQVGQLGRQVVQVGANFEKLEAVLVNTLGSNSEAEAALELIQQYASRTPFQVEEITDAYIRLTNRGLQPTKAELTLLGDLAASQGKSFIQLSEAVLDATQGEFERLKEFGIRASRANGEVTLSFKNQEVQVDDTAEAIQNAILAFGEVEGVIGSTEAIAKTADGTISNFNDAWNRLLASFLNSEGFNRVVGFFTEVINKVRILTGSQDARIQNITDQFLEQRDAIEQTEQKLNPLLTRYDELSTQSELSEEEQDELRKTIVEIGKITPGAVTEIDKYGNALSINAEKSREFLEAEQKRLEFINKDAIRSVNRELEKLRTQRDILQRQSESGTSGGLIPVALTERQLSRVREELGDLQRTIDGAESQLRTLRGQPVIDPPAGGDDGDGPKPKPKPKPKRTREEILRAELKGVEVLINQRKVLLERDQLEREVTRKEYADRLLSLDQELYEQQLELYRKFGEEQSVEALELENELIRINQLRNRNTDVITPLSGQRTTDQVDQQSVELDEVQTFEEQKLARLNNAFERALVSEGEYALAKLEIRRSGLQQEIELLRQGNAQEVALARRKAEELSEVETMIVEQSNENKIRQIEVQKELEESAISAVSEFAQLGADLLTNDKDSREKFAKTTKAFNAAQITAAGIVEVQRIWANAQTFGPLATIIAGVRTAAAAVRTGKALSKINSISYAQGGLRQVGVFGGKPHTQGGTKGYFEDGTAIEVERDELFAVVNKRSTGMIQRLSQLNQAGGGVAFARGGLMKMQSGAITGINTTPRNLPTTSPAQNQVDIMPILDELRAFGRNIQNFPRSVKANIVYSEYESVSDEISIIQDEANL